MNLKEHGKESEDGWDDLHNGIGLPLMLVDADIGVADARTSKPSIFPCMTGLTMTPGRMTHEGIGSRSVGTAKKPQ